MFLKHRLFHLNYPSINDVILPNTSGLFLQKQKPLQQLIFRNADRISYRRTDRRRSVVINFLIHTHAHIAMNSINT